jgi:uncharacterized protein with HEPN domain
MRRDELYLVDMLEAAVAATAFVRDVDETAFGGRECRGQRRCPVEPSQT